LKLKLKKKRGFPGLEVSDEEGEDDDEDGGDEVGELPPL
jgi:hypothetical protein